MGCLTGFANVCGHLLGKILSESWMSLENADDFSLLVGSEPSKRGHRDDLAACGIPGRRR
jgi:hypothetical protein